MRILIACIFLSLQFPSSAFSLTIEAKHRACAKDSDCALVLLKCFCMYCAEPDDVEKGRIDVVNEKFTELFLDRKKCSEAELKHCSLAGACARRGESVPACKEKLCTISYRPIQR